FAQDLGAGVLVGQAAGVDGVAFDHPQRVVVFALGVLARRQRAPAWVAGPGRHAVVVIPLAGAAIARRVADLVHALGPRAAGFFRRQRAHGPGLVGAELEPRRRFVRPVLAR